MQFHPGMETRGNSIPPRKMISKKIHKAVSFLHHEQLDWGEIPVFKLLKSPEASRVYSPSICATAYTLYAISFLQETRPCKEIKSKALRFLLRFREEQGLWRRSGRHSEYGPDLDSTSCALIALAKNRVGPKTCLDDSLLQYRDPKTLLFRTWDCPSPMAENEIDSVVNANMLCVYGLWGKSSNLGPVVQFLIRESKNIHLQNSQVLYYSPCIFAYAVSRAYVEGGVKELRPSISPILEYLIFTQREDGSWGNSVETALATTALMNFAYQGEEVSKGIAAILKAQNDDDGSWVPEIVFIDGGYGSKELSTAICLEALAKFDKTKN